jgi:hypothetical protein
MLRSLLAALLAICLFSTVASGQQVGEIGQYQGRKMVKGTWCTVALFADYRDAVHWIDNQFGVTVQVVDKTGLPILGPFHNALPAAIKTKDVKTFSRPFKWITSPQPKGDMR